MAEKVQKIPPQFARADGSPLVSTSPASLDGHVSWYLQETGLEKERALNEYIVRYEEDSPGVATPSAVFTVAHLVAQGQESYMSPVVCDLSPRNLVAVFAGIPHARVPQTPADSAMLAIDAATEDSSIRGVDPSTQNLLAVLEGEVLQRMGDILADTRDDDHDPLVAALNALEYGYISHLGEALRDRPDIAAVFHDHLGMFHGPIGEITRRDKRMLTGD